MREPNRANPRPHMEKWPWTGHFRHAPMDSQPLFCYRRATQKPRYCGAFDFNPAPEQRRSKRASSRSRQQRRPGPQGAQEEDAARGHFPRDEASRPLRKTLGKEGAGKGGSDPPRPQAGAQEDAARRPAADEAARGSWRGWWCRRRWPRAWRPAAFRRRRRRRLGLLTQLVSTNYLARAVTS